MIERKYEVLYGDTGDLVASEMSLETALLLMKAYCQEYFREHADLELREMDEVTTK